MSQHWRLTKHWHSQTLYRSYRNTQHTFKLQSFWFVLKRWNINDSICRISFLLWSGMMDTFCMQKKRMAVNIMHQSQLTLSWPLMMFSGDGSSACLCLAPVHCCHGRCLCKPCLILLTVAAATEQRKCSAMAHCKKCLSLWRRKMGRDHFRGEEKKVSKE